MNPRYTAFLAAHGDGHKSWVYMDFISTMKQLYTGSIYAPVRNHDDFTDFIIKNSFKYEIPGRSLIK